MKKPYFTFVILSLLFLLISCNKSAEGLFEKVKNDTGFEFVSNPDGTEENTKSILVEVPETSENLVKLDILKNSIDSYLDFLPNIEEKGGFDGELKDYYEWQNSQIRVWLRIRYNENDTIRIILFYTQK